MFVLTGEGFALSQGMSKAIKDTIMKVQVLSNLRGMYLGMSADDDVQRESRLRGSLRIQSLRSRGSNIRFVFREENFG